VRVLIDSACGTRTWSTVGSSPNIIEASWQALADSLEYGLLTSTTSFAFKSYNSHPAATNSSGLTTKMSL